MPPLLPAWNWHQTCSGSPQCFCPKSPFLPHLLLCLCHHRVKITVLESFSVEGYKNRSTTTLPEKAGSCSGRALIEYQCYTTPPIAGLAVTSCLRRPGFFSQSFHHSPTSAQPVLPGNWWGMQGKGMCKKPAQVPPLAYKPPSPDSLSLQKYKLSPSCRPSKQPPSQSTVSIVWRYRQRT